MKSERQGSMSSLVDMSKQVILQEIMGIGGLLLAYLTINDIVLNRSTNDSRSAYCYDFCRYWLSDSCCGQYHLVRSVWPLFSGSRS